MEAYTEHDVAAEAADGKRRDYGAADVAAMIDLFDINIKEFDLFLFEY